VGEKDGVGEAVDVDVDSGVELDVWLGVCVACAGVLEGNSRAVEVVGVGAKVGVTIAAHALLSRIRMSSVLNSLACFEFAI